ncbi:hypothetical protein AZ54_02295 [Xanthomonas oryzae pv. oryzae PXO86]|uniref:Uncharacterized protein n=1 Tax=Xanthomonas oryzae pv. oryzae (strain PXO99A) TaxID=360094 RepID=A0A0K0GGH0_XANOP|nr:hypothetical protein PXO_03750 [Xanthomonas oryzae pv. oryzae PXO99A]AJQ81601.1 hypothetical protein AZ54_02295 [Xanthomonas oryzae pv. oryzae PXO86]
MAQIAHRHARFRHCASPMAARHYAQDSPGCVDAAVWACATIVFRQARA